MARIFINFRNFDGDWAALAIRNTLVERFGDNQVFLSSFSIPPGEDFAAQLLSHASECDVLLAIIGPRWLTVTGTDGRPKLGAADDWVCREIDAALEATGPWCRSCSAVRTACEGRSSATDRRARRHSGLAAGPAAVRRRHERTRSRARDCPGAPGRDRRSRAGVDVEIEIGKLKAGQW